jgi:hypothetical protein
MQALDDVVILSDQYDVSHWTICHSVVMIGLKGVSQEKEKVVHSRGESWLPTNLLAMIT